MINEELCKKCNTLNFLFHTVVKYGNSPVVWQSYDPILKSITRGNIKINTFVEIIYRPEFKVFSK